jgi:small subunit ribosomal protein S17
MERGRLCTVRGTVVSDHMEKTIVVRTERRVKHPQYGKYVRRYTTYYAHDEDRTARVGDVVELASTRPLSKLKRWRLARVLNAAADRAGEIEIARTDESEVES